MRKFNIIIFIVLLSTTAAFAQNTKQDSTKSVKAIPEYGRMILVNKFSENWEIGAKIGTQAYLGEYVTTGPKFKFQDWWNFPAIDANISKWGTNSIGMNIGFTASPMKTLYTMTDTKVTFANENDPFYRTNDEFKVASGWMGNLYVQAMFDLNNAFFGYKRDRFYSLVFNIGGGMMMPLSKTEYRDICASFNLGFDNKFRLNEHLYLNVAVRGTLHDDLFNGISHYVSDGHTKLTVDGTIGVTAGISYRFNFAESKKVDEKGKRVNEEGWTTVNEVVPLTDAYQQAQNDLQAANAGLAVTNTALAIANTKLAEAQNDTVMVYQPEPIMYRHLVNFVIDRWELSNREKVGIMFAAELIKKHPEHKFLVKGYADMQTATPDHNVMLSRNRADVVYDCLVNEFGINPDQLEKSFYGGVDYMFYDDKQCSRSVIISSIEYEK